MGIAAEESLDHFDLLRSLRGSCGEGREAHSLTGSALLSQPAPRNWRSCPRVLSWPFPGCVGAGGGQGSGGVNGCDSVNRGRYGVRYVKAPERRSFGFWGPWALLGSAAMLTLGPGSRVRRGTGSRLGQDCRGLPGVGGGGQLCSMLQSGPTKAKRRGTSETSQVEGPWIFRRVSFPEMGKKSHTGDIWKRGRESKHTVFRASIWAPFDQVSIYW